PGAGGAHHRHRSVQSQRHRRSIMSKIALRHLIDGVWVEGSGEMLVDRNPSRPDDVVAEGAGATAADVDRAYRAARRAGDGWRRTPARSRAAILLRAADIIESHRDGWGR